jgi:hypothetical protein
MRTYHVNDAGTLSGPHNTIAAAYAELQEARHAVVKSEGTNFRPGSPQRIVRAGDVREISLEVHVAGKPVEWADSEVNELTALRMNDRKY